MSVDVFVSDLAAHADVGAQPAILPIVARLSRPLRVRTTGRPGVGRRTLDAALRDARLTPVDSAAEVGVLVIAEAAKPEDCLATAEAAGPVLIALNKADLLGTAARDRSSRIAEATGRPVVPVSALLAAADLDGDQIAALQVLAAGPVVLDSVDAFRTAPHALDSGTRAQLLAALDLFGITAAIEALRSGSDPAALSTLLRRSSNIDELLAGIHAVSAQLRYRRLRSAMTQLRALAARTDDQRLERLLVTDNAVLAVAEAATEVLRADGVDTEPGEPLQRARRWQRYGQGPVGDLHRSCSRDIVRGALR